MDENFTAKLPLKKKSSLCRKVAMAVYLLLLTFSLAYFALSMISANKTLETYNITHGITNDAEPVAKSFVPYEMAFLEARHAMSRVDSSSLSLNLTDSLASIEMGGVVLFEARLIGSRVSPLLTAMKPEALSNLLRSPSRVTSYYATIEKDPVIVKQAPRDTIEAAMADDEIPVVTRQTAFFTLNLDSGIRIVVMPHDEGGIKRLVYIAKQNFYIFRKRVSTIFSGRLPNHVPLVMIEVSADDAKVLFRALPANARVALRL